MEILFEMISYPFMQRALVAGALLGVLLASLGTIATVRKMAFFGEGIAHASLAGIALAVLAGFTPLPFAIAWAIITSVLIFGLEKSTKLSSDSLIGILFTASMALGVIIMSFTDGYQPELLSFLFGSILTIKMVDLTIISAVSIVILCWFYYSIKQLAYLSLSEESAAASGINVNLQTLTLYIALAVATVLGVKILGIVLVSALIVLPAATSKMLTDSFKSYLIVSIIVSEIVIILGITFSFIWDLPTGAVIVLVGTLGFLIASVVRKI